MTGVDRIDVPEAGRTDVPEAGRTDGPPWVASAGEDQRVTRTWRVPPSRDACADAYEALDAVADGEVVQGGAGDCRVSYRDGDQLTKFTTDEGYLLAKVYTYDEPAFG